MAHRRIVAGGNRHVRRVLQPRGGQRHHYPNRVSRVGSFLLRRRNSQQTHHHGRGSLGKQRFSHRRRALATSTTSSSAFPKIRNRERCPEPGVTPTVAISNAPAYSCLSPVAPGGAWAGAAGAITSSAYAPPATALENAHLCCRVRPLTPPCRCPPVPPRPTSLLLVDLRSRTISPPAFLSCRMRRFFCRRRRGNRVSTATRRCRRHRCMGPVLLGGAGGGVGAAVRERGSREGCKSVSCDSAERNVGQKKWC